MFISDLFSLLATRIRDRLRHGEFTERALARRAGISQPHLNNVLKGKREMSPRIADALLRELGLSVETLIELSAPARDVYRESGLDPGEAA